MENRVLGMTDGPEPKREDGEVDWIRGVEPATPTYAAFQEDRFDPEGPRRSRVGPFESYAAAAEFVGVNFWFGGIDYWNGSRWLLDVEGEVLLPSGPDQRRRLSAVADDLAGTEAVLRRAALLLGREDLAGDVRGVGPKVGELAHVVHDIVARLRAAVGSD